ncbi:MAG: hypothetical protein EHM85_05850 [Desulfobacteraceae bacterium]|nr:MAG: hypothetical protein EHM85_05850 [Desulfobacteraceae bacterium]
MNARTTNNLLLHLKVQWKKYLTKKEVRKIIRVCNIDAHEISEIKSIQIVNNKELTSKVHVKTRNKEGKIKENIILISFRLGPPTWEQFIRTTYRSGSNAGIRIIIYEGNVSCIGELVDNNNNCDLKTYLIEAKGLIQRIFEGKASQIIYIYENGPVLNDHPAEPLPSMRQVQELEFWTCYYLPAWNEPFDKPMGLHDNHEKWDKVYKDLSLPVIWNDDGLHLNLTGDPNSELIKLIWENKLGAIKKEYPEAKIKLMEAPGTPYGISIRISDLPMNSLIKMGPKKKNHYAEFIRDAEHSFMHFIDNILIDLKNMGKFIK